MNYTLYSAEILFNKDLSNIHLGSVEDGLLDVEHARASRAAEEHDMIDDAIATKGQDRTIFSIVNLSLDLQWHDTRSSLYANTASGGVL